MLRPVQDKPEQGPTATAASRWSSSWRALRHRNYRLYFCGQVVSLLGSWIQQVALGWLAYRLTGSPLLLGSVAFLGQAPQLVGAPLAGIVIDRSDRRRLMLQVQFLLLLQALALALLSELQWIQPWHILLAAAALGILNCFDAPLRHALAAQLVDDRNDLPNAVALNSLTFNVARFVGPPLAGLALGLTSEAACFALNGLSFVAVIAALLRIRLAPAKPMAGAFGEALREGLRYTMENLPVRSLLLQVAILNFLAASYVPLMPPFAWDVFHGGPDTLGMLLGSAGAGALGAALYLVARPSIRGLTGAIAGGNGLAALSLIGFALAHQAWLGMALLFLVGFGLIIANASSNTILQAILPDYLRGRVLALYTSAALGSAAAGGLIAGLVAERAGVQPTFLGIGIVLLLAALRFRARLALLREHLRPLYLALGIPPRPGRDHPIWEGEARHENCGAG
jgi:MFS family permease